MLKKFKTWLRKVLKEFLQYELTEDDYKSIAALVQLRIPPVEPQAPFTGDKAVLISYTKHPTEVNHVLAVFAKNKADGSGLHPHADLNHPEIWRRECSIPHMEGASHEEIVETIYKHKSSWV